MTITAAKEKFKTSRESFSDVAVVSVKLGREDLTVAAYEDSRIPSILVTRDTFSDDTSENQRMVFTRVSFEEFEGYKVWCCEIDGEELKACLVR